MKIHPAADTADLVVVGAGIVGLGAAYAGIRRGLSVIVLDRTAAPVGASIRNFGHLCIGAQTGMARRFADASAEIWKRLATDAGFWLRASGTLIAAQRSRARQTTPAFGCCRLSPCAVVRRCGPMP